MNVQKELNRGQNRIKKVDSWSEIIEKKQSQINK